METSASALLERETAEGLADSLAIETQAAHESERPGPQRRLGELAMNEIEPPVLVDHYEVPARPLTASLLETVRQEFRRRRAAGRTALRSRRLA